VLHSTPGKTRPSLGHPVTSGAAGARFAARDPRRIVFVTVTAVLVAVAFYTAWSLIAPIILGAWCAHIARPVYVRASRLLHGRQKAAAVLTALLLVLVALPIVLGALALIPAVRGLVEQLKQASGGKGVLTALVSGGSTPNGGGGLPDPIALVKDYGSSAASALFAALSVSAEVVIGAFVFFVVFNALLVRGGAWFDWLEAHAPAEPGVLRRLAAVFHEAGRGLLVGTGLTAIVQGGLATAIYVALGIPRAILFGLLTVAAALIPITGPAIVWVPVCAGLALSGQPGKAALLAVLCAVLVGTIDNVVRPWLSRRANVGLPTTIVLVSMLGGIAAFGGWGLLLGPLVVRLAAEALSIARERRMFLRRAAR
jgi:predicted PurR-regulated permease PerM